MLSAQRHHLPAQLAEAQYPVALTCHLLHHLGGADKGVGTLGGVHLGAADFQQRRTLNGIGFVVAGIAVFQRLDIAIAIEEDLLRLLGGSFELIDGESILLVEHMALVTEGEALLRQI